MKLRICRLASALRPHPSSIFALLLLLITLPLAHADNPVPLPAVTVTAAIEPKRVSFTKVIKSGKSFPVDVTYLITNHTADTQVINLFCTVQLAITLDDGRPLVLQGMGADGFGIQKALHILTIAPGKQQTLLVRIDLLTTPKGLLLERDTEDGESWGGTLPIDAKFIDIAATYADPLTRDAVEKFRPELKTVKYAQPSLKLPSIRLEFAK